MKLLFLLLVIFQVKHLVCDYFLQGEYMLGKFKPDWSFFWPLLAHAGTHAFFTCVISTFLVPFHIALLLGLFDGTIHFIMDRIKAGPKYLGRFKPLSAEQWQYYKGRTVRNTVIGYELQNEAIAKLDGNRWFWISLGIDQMVHHLTHYGVIYIILLFH